jgi:hypothetical protein
MLSTQIMKLAERYQWKTNLKEETIFGEYGGYLFTLIEGKRFKSYITSVSGIDPESLQAIARYLKDQSGNLHLVNFEFSDNFLCVRQAQGFFPLSVEKMEYMLGQISGLLSLYELPPDNCLICGQSAQRKGLYLGLYCHLHAACEGQDMIDCTATETDDADIPEAEPDPAAEAEPAAEADTAAEPDPAAEPDTTQPS